MYRIHIESEDAVTSSIGGRFRPPILLDDDVVIAINVQHQQKEHWCWAALASSLAGYYATGSWTQEQIALAVALRDAQQEKQKNPVTRDNTNVNTTLDKALQLCGCMSHWSPGKPSFARMQFEINLGRPLCVRVQWHGGDAHYVMLHGYNAATRQVLIQDTLHGAARLGYDDFPRDYGAGGGVWTETYWTDKLPKERKGYEQF